MNIKWNLLFLLTWCIAIWWRQFRWWLWINEKKNFRVTSIHPTRKKKNSKISTLIQFASLNENATNDNNNALWMKRPSIHIKIQNHIIITTPFFWVNLIIFKHFPAWEASFGHDGDVPICINILDIWSKRVNYDVRM